MAEAGSSSWGALGFPVPTFGVSIVETPHRKGTVPQVSGHHSNASIQTLRKVICKEQMRMKYYCILQNSYITRAVIFRFFTNVRSSWRMC